MNRIIGVLWKKRKDDQDYYSGVIRDLHGEINIAVFPNNRKETTNQPDMNIVVSWGYDKNTGQEPVEAVTEPAKKNGKKKKAEVVDETPF